MNKIVIVISFLSVSFNVSSCRNDRSKTELASIVRIRNSNLYVQTFTIVGNGAFGGDRISDYLTDSVNFRIYIGTYDNGDEGFSYKCTGDSISISKIIGRRENENKIVNSKSYKLSELRNKKIFD